MIQDFDYTYGMDDQGDLAVTLFDPVSEKVIDTLGGIEVEFTISDHGNINVAPDGERYLYDRAAELARDHRGFLITRRPRVNA